jgi:SHS2 domain-containing protein
METPRGHAARAHTADVVIEAWAPDREGCLAEAVVAAVEVFADTSRSSGGDERGFSIRAGDTDRMLVSLIEELMTLVDADGVVPVAIHLEPAADGGIVATFTVVPLDEVELIGPAPKGVSYEGLEAGTDGTAWRCRAIIDV